MAADTDGMPARQQIEHQAERELSERQVPGIRWSISRYPETQRKCDSRYQEPEWQAKGIPGGLLACLSPDFR